MLASAMATGGYIFGLLFDRHGDYRMALIVGGVAYACSAALIILSGIVGKDFDHFEAADTT